MNSEALIQAAIRAVVAGVLTAIPVLIGFLTAQEGVEAMGQWAIYLPIAVGILNGIAKAIGGATAPMPTPGADGVRGAGAEAKRPGILAI